MHPLLRPTVGGACMPTVFSHGWPSDGWDFVAGCAHVAYNYASPLNDRSTFWWSYSVVVITPDFESGTVGSNPSRTTYQPVFIVASQASALLMFDRPGGAVATYSFDKFMELMIYKTKWK